MNIGIIGLGVVGNACKSGFEKIGHIVKVHDVKLNTKISDVLDTDICFVSVPTPANDDWSCNTTIVEDVVKQMNDLKYDKPLCIKSTIEPGTIKTLRNKFPNLRLYFVPEFLRERCAEEDFIYNHNVLVIGAEDDDVYKLVKKTHGNLPTHIVQMKASEAELVKYFSNSYKALRITFANSFYELCKSKGVNYKNIKDAISNRKTINDFYLDCSEDLRGFGGMCLPKDTKELAFLSKKLKTTVEFFDNILKENEKYKTTVFKGMRE